ncbi:MAG TPA: hypothetical protein VGX69_07510 [Solirubrobacteraceae bacterium]|jgi:hypothetical protein|nr:hypothetical protein [Solirubrobacteraceae bacterium]
MRLRSMTAALVCVVAASLGVAYAAQARAGTAEPHKGLSGTPCGLATGATLAAVDGDVAERIYRDELEGPSTALDKRQVERYGPLLAAVSSGDVAAIKQAVTELVFSHTHIVRLRVSEGGKLLADVGGPYVIAPAAGELRVNGRSLASYELSVQDDRGFVGLEQRLIGAPLILRLAGRRVPIEGTFAETPLALPSRGVSIIRHTAYQVYSFNARAYPAGSLRISLLLAPQHPSGRSCAQVRVTETTRIAQRIWGRFSLDKSPVSGFVTFAQSHTGALVYVRRGARQLAGSARGPARLPLAGAVSYRSRTYGVASFAGASAGGAVRIYLLVPLGANARALNPVSRAARRSVRARTADAGYTTGIGDNNPGMFTSSYWQRLHTRLVRYVAPYDAVAHRASLRAATAYIRAAEAAHQQILVEFYHSAYSPTTLPSVAQYKHYVQKFAKLFPHVHEYASWDEANRGNVAHLFSSPSARASARYYQALIRVCSKCTVIGLDILDGQYLRPPLEYIAEFKSEIGRLETVMPHIWGLHDYVDLNHFEDWRTRDLSRALGGSVWLTEAGGIVKLAGAFSNSDGSGLRRAAKVVEYTFNVARAIPQVKRLYLYNWTGTPQSARWDSGITNLHLLPRPAWVAACHALHAQRCAVRTSKS